MDSNNTSRLPAGSILELANGIRVPHPHAAVNLAGAGDGRLSDSAVLEVHTLVIQELPPHEEPKATVITATTVQVPLADSVRPKVITTRGEAQ